MRFFFDTDGSDWFMIPVHMKPTWLMMKEKDNKVEYDSWAQFDEFKLDKHISAFNFTITA